MADVFVLDVLLYGEPIGTLTNVGGDRTIFAFNDAHIDNPDRPTLGLAFKDEFGALLTDFRPYQKRVMPFFSNLLPEGHLRKYLSENVGVNPEREFHLLWAFGHDLPGAVTIKPADGEAWPPIGGESTDVDETEGGRREHALRFSLAGVQLKFSAVLAPTGGLTIPASGVGGSWIVKLPSREFKGVPENEFSMMTLARLIGIDVPPIDLVDVGSIKNLPEGIDKIGQSAFVIERFDRLSDGSAVHIEDFAQVFDVYAEQKYKTATLRNIAQVLAAETSDADIAEFIRRLVFCVLIGNGDMHMKNWSLIYPDRRNAALAPAYDLVSTIPYIPSDNMGLRISRTRAFSELTNDELEHLAAKAAIPEKLVLDTAHEAAARFHQHWQAEKHNLPMTKQVREAIEAHIKSLPIAQ
ncbi:HipA domain-containing protein [Halomonas sp. CUBES01]|uniref:type II toxin-antitoxin system HipA family toxin n=1 Tax=Halomonas sp. CUBES01 TaxID=2897340 RepID=UPI001E3B2BF2|nr:HipA domain-containing protein [Halomonas sp. CUBES01]MEC4766728.1 HipA domain-containing protein [Halomonas sp. CUBES01]